MTVEKYISPFVQNQFPEFYKEYGPNFIAFVQAYYEWMESVGNPINYSRNIYEYSDIDTTLDNFVKYFKNKYMLSIPQSIAADKRLVIKHILDLYKSKGSIRAYELLFRLLFDEDIEVYIPGDDLFRLSNNRYVKPYYVEVSDSVYLNDLIGRTIYSSDGGATATVENYYVKSVGNKIINVLIIGNITGVFRYNDRIQCDDLYVNSSGDTIGAYEYNNLSTTQKQSYSLALTAANGPFIIGSLSSVGIINGGTGFEVGELLNVYSGDGSGGLARVASVRDENGKVTFTLQDGGSGFSVNAAVTVTGGGGTGASFKVGGITDKEVFRISTDIIDSYKSTQLDVTSGGANLQITGVTGTFNVNNTVYSTAQVNVITADVTVLVDNVIANGENFTNTSLGINSLVGYRTDGSLIYFRGTDITNANLTIGTVLVSNTTASVISINSKFAVQNTYGNGTVSFVNSSVLSVTGDFGYFVPGFGITSSSGATATVTGITRNTNWGFPTPTLGKQNLDTAIGLVLNIYDLEVGTISYLSQINPGQGYSSDPVVDITEPAIYDLRIPDKSSYKGHNAIVTAKAGSGTGIVTSVEITDSGFGYTPETFANLMSTNTENQTVVTGVAVVAKQGVDTGYFESRSGFLSDTQHVIDSKYWQMQSYDISVNRMLSSYESLVRGLVHPAGIALFGTYRLQSEPDNASIQPTYFSYNSADALISPWVQSVMSYGAPISNTRINLLAAFMQSLNADGTLAQIDDMWVFAAENETQSLISLKQLIRASAINSPTFIVDRGYSFNGTNNFVNTNYSPRDKAIAMTGNSMHFSIYERTNIASASFIGANGWVTAMQIAIRPRSSSVASWYLNSGGHTATVPGADVRGLSAFTRTFDGANTTFFYHKNGAYANTGTGIAYNLPLVNTAIYLGAYNSKSAVVSYRSSNTAFFSIGGSLSNTQHATLYNAVNTLFTAIGANVA